jgi:hypothetical protein
MKLTFERRLPLLFWWHWDMNAVPLTISLARFLWFTRDDFSEEKNRPIHHFAVELIMYFPS